MKDQILKMAGVKSEKEFYKKFPTEETFKAKYGKQLKKAEMGRKMVNTQLHQLTDFGNPPIAQNGINFSDLMTNAGAKNAGMSAQAYTAAQQKQQQAKVQEKQQQDKGLQKKQQTQQTNKPSQPVQRVQQSEERSVWQQHRANSWQTEHRTWQQRGGYDGYRIPDYHFRGYFGRHHGFRIFSLSLEIFGGHPRFQYGGYWFSVLDPWPEYWPDDWYENDDVYIDYSGDGYYMYNRRYPRDRIAVSVFVN